MAEPGQRHRHLEHLLLVDDRAEGVLQRPLQQRVLVGDLELAGFLALSFASLYIRVDRAALDRPRPDQRHLHGHVVEVFRPRARQHLHLRPALDLEDAGRLGAVDRPVGLFVVERDPREVEPLPLGHLEFVDAALDRGEHPQPEQVDLEEAGVRAGVLVPLNDLPTLHRRRHDRADVDQRLGRDHHAAGVLGGVAGQSHRLAGEAQQRLPARGSGALVADRGDHVALDFPRRLVEADRARDLLDLARPQPQRLAEVADDPARPVGREGGDECGAVGPVALVHPRDQHLAHVAGEVEVDVRHRLRFLVEEAAGVQARFDRVDVREAGQVADDRADAGAATAAGRHPGAGSVTSPHLRRHLAGQLQQVVVEEEEARELEVADRPQLLVEPGPRFGPGAGRLVPVASTEQVVAEPREVAVGVQVLRLRIAVAELLGQVEAEPVGEAQRLRHRLRVLGEARRHLLPARPAPSCGCRGGTARTPPASRRDGRRRRRPAGWRRRGAWEWTLPVATQGTPRREASRASQRLRARSWRQKGRCSSTRKRSRPKAASRRRPRRLAALGHPALEGPGQDPVTGAAGEADEPLGVLLHLLQRRPGLGGGAAGVVAGVGVGRGQQPAEVAIPGRVFDQEGEVGEIGRGLQVRGRRRQRHGQLGADDRAQVELPAGLGELARSPDPVVVGQRQSRIAVDLGGDGQLRRGRGAVEEGEARVRVQLDVRGGAHQARCRYQRPVIRQRKTTTERPSIRASSK